MSAPAREVGDPNAAVALLSGGLDSGAALALWLAADPARRAEALFVDYGQRAATPEADASRRLAERLGCPWRRVDLPALGDAARRAGSALARGVDAELPSSGTAEQPGDAASAAAVWVPARNVVLVSLAAAAAEAAGAGVVLCGFNREEAATFADNSPEFVTAANRLLELGTRVGVHVASPTLELDKPAIVTAARGLGLTRDDFWSCYTEGPLPCGRCESCRRSDRAWAR